MNKELLCPIMSVHKQVECIKGNCAWWVSVYTTEGIRHECCAIEMIAIKNENGQYTV